MAGVDRMTIEEVVRKALIDDHADVIRESVRWMVQEMMEAEVTDLIGAERGERKPEDRCRLRQSIKAARHRRIRAAPSVAAESHSRVR